MQLREYLKGKDRKEFACKIGTTKNYVNLLACMDRRPGPNLAARIEQATDGQVSRMELLYPEEPNKYRIMK